MDSFTGTVGNGREEVPKREAGGGACDQKAKGRSWMDRTTDVHFSLPGDLSSLGCKLRPPTSPKTKLIVSKMVC